MQKSQKSQNHPKPQTPTDGCRNAVERGTLLVLIEGAIKSQQVALRLARRWWLDDEEMQEAIGSVGDPPKFDIHDFVLWLDAMLVQWAQPCSKAERLSYAAALEEWVASVKERVEDSTEWDDDGPDPRLN